MDSWAILFGFLLPEGCKHMIRTQLSAQPAKAQVSPACKGSNQPSLQRLISAKHVSQRLAGTLATALISLAAPSKHARDGAHLSCTLASLWWPRALAPPPPRRRQLLSRWLRACRPCGSSCSALGHRRHRLGASLSPSRRRPRHRRRTASSAPDLR